ncbi:MAG: PilZ domain-containing protein [Deltaproteobacteria bacterium]|nr:MAG: PilZ domain-containing protein [Deltaproteobacteria bacterium]
MTAKERRRTRRYPVTFRLVCSDGRAFRPGTVLDLSLGGVRFRTSWSLEVGTSVELLPLGDAGDVLFAVKGRVVRVEPAEDRADRWHVALAFEDVDDEVLESLRRLTCEMPPVYGTTVDPDPPPSANDGPKPDESLPHMRIRARISAGVDRLTGT